MGLHRAERRLGDDSAAAGLELLGRRMRKVCGQEIDWERRLVAGIRTALEFAASNPDEARAMTLDAPWADQEEVIEHFTALLAETAPEDERFPISTDRAIVESIALVIRGHVTAGSTSALPALAPDLAYLALLPYVGLEGARRGAAVGTATRV